MSIRPEWEAAISVKVEDTSDAEATLQAWEVTIGIGVEGSRVEAMWVVRREAASSASSPVVICG